MKTLQANRDFPPEVRTYLTSIEDFDTNPPGWGAPVLMTPNKDPPQLERRQRQRLGPPPPPSINGRFHRPATADPCGERGEFHTSVSAGSIFSRSIAVSPAEVVTRDGFVYADLLPHPIS